MALGGATISLFCPRADVDTDLSIPPYRKNYRGAMVNFPDFTGGKEFVVNSGKLVDTGNIKDGEEPNMADGQTLLDFVSRTFRQHPADHYGLIMWDHGTQFVLQVFTA